MHGPPDEMERRVAVGVIEIDCECMASVFDQEVDPVGLDPFEMPKDDLISDIGLNHASASGNRVVGAIGMI